MTVLLVPGLQLHSILYRFFPSVNWSEAYPKRDEIVGEVQKIVDEYGLESRIHLKTPVTKVQRDQRTSTDPHKAGHARWIINEDENQYGVFDAVVVTVGTCGKRKMLELDGSDKFKGQVVHSSQLDGVEMEGKRVVVVGSGASGVEAIGLAIQKGAERATILARSDKWVIPRSWIVGAALAMQPLGRETWLSWIPEGLLRNLVRHMIRECSRTSSTAISRT